MDWQGIRAEVLRRIEARDYPPGGSIPNEADLAAEFGCARATVNRALRELARAGRIERRRKAGTRVPLAPVRQAVLSIPIIRHDIAARGLAPGYRLISAALGRPDAATRAALEAGAGPAAAQLWHVVGLHTGDGAPFVLEDRWINPEAVAGLGPESFAAISANEWLVAHAGFSAGRIAFGAVSATPATARLLGCTPAAPLLRLTRTTRSGPRPVTLVRLSYAPGHEIATGF